MNVFNLKLDFLLTREVLLLAEVRESGLTGILTLRSQTWPWSILSILVVFVFLHFLPLFLRCQRWKFLVKCWRLVTHKTPCNMIRICQDFPTSNACPHSCKLVVLGPNFYFTNLCMQGSRYCSHQAVLFQFFFHFVLGSKRVHFPDNSLPLCQVLPADTTPLYNSIVDHATYN